MRRRAFLVGTAGIAATAGCTTISSNGDGIDTGHPFADSTVTVRIDEDSDTSHDLQANAQRALEYWEANSQTYVEFDIEFDVVEADDPDMVIAYADTPESCENVPGFSERVLGCAPVWRPDRQLPRPAVARVVAGARPFGKVAITTKHEIGHILGLNHDDEPREIMSSRPEDRIPMYQLRIDIWESVLETQERVNETNSLYAYAITRWNEQDYAGAQPAFADASERFAAAATAFEDARIKADGFEGDPRVETVNLAGVRSLLSQLSDRTSAIASAAGAMDAAAAAAAQGDVTTANTRREAANEFLLTFREAGVLQLRDIAIALGLVRGFDRDEPVVDIDEEDVERTAETE